MLKLKGVDGIDFTIEVDGRDEKYNLNNLFLIDEDDLTTEFSEQPALYARFSFLLARVDREVARAKMVKEQEYAKADEIAREAFVEEGQKFTEAAVRGQVLQDEEYNKAEHDLIDIEGLHSILKAVVFAMSQRADMLISLGAQVRSELGMTGMNIKEKVLEDRIEEAKKVLKARKQV